MGKKAERRAAAAADAAAPAPDRHELYAQAVQSPKGDIAYLCRFYAQYASPRVPLHLREDFCGTAALCAAWCATDPRRSATGTDLDDVELAWGAAHALPAAAGGGDAAERLCLLHADVLNDPLAAPRLATGWGAGGDGGAPSSWQELRARRGDIGCALNSAICFMHSREDADRYCRQARAMTAAPGIFVMDLQGGATMEKALTQRTRLPGGSVDYLWTQDGFDPVSRLISCHIGFRLRGRRGAPPPPTPPALRRAFSYRWRLWTLPEVCDMLRLAGFASTHVWLRRMREDGEAPSDGEEESDDEDDDGGDDGSESGSSDGDDGSGGERGGGGRRGGQRREGKSSDEYVEVTAATPAAALHRYARGWQAYIVAVAR